MELHLALLTQNKLVNAEPINSLSRSSLLCITEWKSAEWVLRGPTERSRATRIKVGPCFTSSAGAQRRSTVPQRLSLPAGRTLCFPVLSYTGARQQGARNQRQEFSIYHSSFNLRIKNGISKTFHQ